MARKIFLSGLTLIMIVILVFALSASAKLKSPIAINNMEYEVTSIEKRDFDNGRIGLQLAAVGKGTVDCLENEACAASGLGGTAVEIHQVFVLMINIDHTSAGIKGGTTGDIVDPIFPVSAEFQGTVKGDIKSSDNERYDISMNIYGKMKNGRRITQELKGVFNKTEGSFESLIGQCLLGGLLHTYIE